MGVVNISEGLSHPLYISHLESYDHANVSGWFADMHYLVKGRDRRQDPRALFPAAQSVLCVMKPYSTQPYLNNLGQSFARYSRGLDYHDDIFKCLQTALEEWSQELELCSSVKWKICVDTSALLERTWAQLAGLGWIGKNGLLLHREYGSYTLLGFALINVEFDSAIQLHANFCGACTRCLSGCPTGAFPGPYQLDARRCLSYLTLEKKGEFTSAEQDLVASNSWVAGCDRCQEVCPFNQKRTKNESTPASVPLDPLMEIDEEKLTQISDLEFRIMTKNSSLSRMKRPMFLRNIVTALNRKKRFPAE